MINRSAERHIGVKRYGTSEWVILAPGLMTSLITSRIGCQGKAVNSDYPTREELPLPPDANIPLAEHGRRSACPTRPCTESQTSQRFVRAVSTHIATPCYGY